MAITKVPDVFEIYERAKSGPKVEEKDWDYKIIPRLPQR